MAKSQPHKEKSTQVTRGDGLLEAYLSKKRSQKANSLIKKKLRTGRILDIGCGSYPYFLLNTNFKEKFGIDPSLSKVEIDNLELKKTNISKERIRFENDFFDVVTLLAVFEHIDDNKLSFVLKEIFRVLKRDGQLIITTPSPWSDKLLHNMAKVGLISSEEIHEHKTHHPKKVIENMLITSGFEKKGVKSGYFEAGFNMWFVAQK